MRVIGKYFMLLMVLFIASSQPNISYSAEAGTTPPLVGPPEPPPLVGPPRPPATPHKPCDGKARGIIAPIIECIDASIANLSFNAEGLRKNLSGIVGALLAIYLLFEAIKYFFMLSKGGEAKLGEDGKKQFFTKILLIMLVSTVIYSSGHRMFINFANDTQNALINLINDVFNVIVEDGRITDFIYEGGEIGTLDEFETRSSEAKNLAYSQELTVWERVDCVLMQVIGFNDGSESFIDCYNYKDYVNDEDANDKGSSQGTNWIIVLGIIAIAIVFIPIFSFVGILAIVILFFIITFVASIVLISMTIFTTSKLALNFMLWFLPVFVPLILFKSTKRMFDVWFQATIIYVFIPALLLGLVMMGIFAMDKLYSQFLYPIYEETYLSNSVQNQDLRHDESTADVSREEIRCDAEGIQIRVRENAQEGTTAEQTGNFCNEEVEEKDKDGCGTKYIRPSKGRISSGYGYRIHPKTGKRKLHKGVDIAAPKGTIIVATQCGKLVNSWSRKGCKEGDSSCGGGYGNRLAIEHPDGSVSYYAHLAAHEPNIFRSNTLIKQGAIIGFMGNTGSSTGSHLHFEIYRNKNYVDPMAVIEGKFHAIGGGIYNATGSEFGGESSTTLGLSPPQWRVILIGLLATLLGFALVFQFIVTALASTEVISGMSGTGTGAITTARQLMPKYAKKAFKFIKPGKKKK